MLGIRNATDLFWIYASSVYPHIWPVTRVAEPILCLSDTSISTLTELARCFNNYTVLGDTYSIETYSQAQPTAFQLKGWEDLITSMLYVSDNCGSVKVPSSLQDIYAVTSFINEPDGRKFCIASEIYANPLNNYYTKGWGIFMVPANDSLGIHIGSPHPMFDFYTPDQAVALFQDSGAKSLLISGRHRSAYGTPSSCVPSTGSATYYATDSTHDVNEPYNTASKTIYAWQEANGGCPPASCAFIQLHAKASTSCSSVDIMVSAGLGHADADWYLDDIDRPAKRLRAELEKSFPSRNVVLPSDTTCSLTATKNVFGRLLNGVPESAVCRQAAQASQATGQFIHVEQAYQMTLEDAYEGWVNALKATF